MSIPLLLLLLAVCACGTSDGSDITDDAGGDGSGSGSGSGGLGVNQSGTRIKMKVLSSPDGAKVFQGSFDSQRNEDCSFQRAADGMMRCLPTSVAGDFGSYYGDAACSVPVALWQFASCSPPTYVAVYAASAQCPTSPTGGTGIYARGTTYSSYYVKSGATCSGPNTIPGYTFFGRGTEVQASSFQAATTSIE
jgi:hypothetical protein